MVKVILDDHLKGVRDLSRFGFFQTSVLDLILYTVESAIPRHDNSSLSHYSMVQALLNGWDRPITGNELASAVNALGSSWVLENEHIRMATYRLSEDLYRPIMSSPFLEPIGYMQMRREPAYTAENHDRMAREYMEQLTRKLRERSLREEREREQLISGTMESVANLLASQMGVNPSFLTTGRSESIGTGRGFASNNPAVRREIARLTGQGAEPGHLESQMASPLIQRRDFLSGFLRFVRNPAGTIVARAISSLNRWVLRRGNNIPLAIIAMAIGLSSWQTLFGPIASRSMEIVSGRPTLSLHVSPRMSPAVALRAA